MVKFNKMKGLYSSAFYEYFHTQLTESFVSILSKNVSLTHSKQTHV